MPGTEVSPNAPAAPIVNQEGGRRRSGKSVKTIKKMLKKAGLKTTGKKSTLTRRAKKAKLMKGGAGFGVGDIVIVKDMGGGWKVVSVEPGKPIYTVVRNGEQTTAKESDISLDEVHYPRRKGGNYKLY
jgi:hypothetical protein